MLLLAYAVHAMLIKVATNSSIIGMDKVSEHGMDKSRGQKHELLILWHSH